MKFRTWRPATTGIFALAILAGCGGDSGGPSSPPASLSVLNETLRSGEVLVVAGTGLAPFADSVPAQLGASTFSLLRLNDSTAAGLAPAVTAGSQDLTLTLTDTVAVLPMTVLEALTFADPVAAIGAVLDAQLASFPADAPAGEDSAAWAAESALLDSLVAEAKVTAGDLTTEEQLVLARLLAPLGAGAPAPFAAAPSLLGEAACDSAQSSLLAASYHATKFFATAMVADVAGLFSDDLEKTLQVASTNAMREVRLELGGRNRKCRVPRKVEYVSFGVRGAPQPSAATSTESQAVGPDRFFKGYRMRYSLSGDLRPVSQQELSKNSLLAAVDAAYRKLRELALGNLTSFPAWAQGIIGTLPPSVAETLPGPVTTEALAPGQVRIERVSPASVSLTPGAFGEEFTLTSNTTVTNDLPFTYDLVAVADPTVRRSMSGVLRPFMSASFGASGVVFTGTRSQVMIDGFEYGELRCGGSRMLKVTGGDKGTWQAFEWTLSSAKSAADSVSEPLGGGEFEAGDHPFQGEWYFRWRENDSPMFIPFTVGLRVSYIDQVTDSLKYSNEFWFTCQ